MAQYTELGRMGTKPPEVGVMRMEDMVLVSVDDHVIEPPDMFEGRVPAKYAENAPRFVTDESGLQNWVYSGQTSPSAGLNAVAGSQPDEYGLEPANLDEMRKGAYDVDARIMDMNANGVLGSLCFPSFPKFCGQMFAAAPDKEEGLAFLQAYNDWHIEDWCDAYPGRFIPLGLVPIWDPALMAREVHRLASKGAHAVTFSENPAKLGYPSLHSESWEPFWQACSDEGTVVCMHIGSSSQLVVTADDAPVDVLITLSPINIVQAAADLLWSPVLRQFPKLRIALSEGGIGWIPYFLERADYVYKHHKAWTYQDFGDRLPSEVFLEQVVTCFIDDAVGIENRHHLNLNHITWECDYPHSDSTWPNAPELAFSFLNGLSDEEIDKITHQNAMRVFQFDPFDLRAKEECTVAALRQQAAGWDVSVQSMRYRKSAATGTSSANLVTMTGSTK